MGPRLSRVIPLSRAGEAGAIRVGGKALRLARLEEVGFPVPRGFCLPVEAYDDFVEARRLRKLLELELGRRPLDSMRWEELWDASLRIRNAFQRAEMPEGLAVEILAAARDLEAEALVVRSSAPGEDEGAASFAGLHESVVGVAPTGELLDAVRVVWASLWSEAALMYRRELGLEVWGSQMAVVVQALVERPVSGVGFARDPRRHEADRMLLEAVPGLCRDLVDGERDPDRWVLERSTGRILDWQRGERDGVGDSPLLSVPEVGFLRQTLLEVEDALGWPPDLEWTGTGPDLRVLQARPISTGGAPADGRAYYLGLTPGDRRLDDLARRVSETRIPALEERGRSLAEVDLRALGDELLAAALEERSAALDDWRRIYVEEFIPLAHGVRRLGRYYNDAVHPEDPFEFVGLLRGERLAAMERNGRLEELARLLREDAALYGAAAAGSPAPEALRSRVQSLPGGAALAEGFERMLHEGMDVSFEGERLSGRPDLLWRVLAEMASREPGHAGPPRPEPALLEQRLFEGVGAGRRTEADHVLRLGRLAWRLRDDDNLLVGRLESQLARAMVEGAARLRAQGRLEGEGFMEEALAAPLAAALRDPGAPRVVVDRVRAAPLSVLEEGAGRPRQVSGQPAAPGLATGPARVILGPEDLGRFRAGEVLVCDAIQPTMTHLVPLACAVVERRGGMLIHGAIIARELGLPCVNGVDGATRRLATGHVLTVDGYLGVVTVGPPEFGLEGLD